MIERTVTAMARYHSLKLGDRALIVRLRSTDVGEQECCKRTRGKPRTKRVDRLPGRVQTATAKMHIGRHVTRRQTRRVLGPQRPDDRIHRLIFLSAQRQIDGQTRNLEPGPGSPPQACAPP